MKVSGIIGIVIGAAMASAFGMVSPASATVPHGHTSCQPYNSHFQVCTRTFFNHGTGLWEQETFFQPYPDNVATID
jgi:hypothetical protein